MMAEEKIAELEQQVYNLQTMLVNMQVLGHQNTSSALMHTALPPEKYSFEKEDWFEWITGYERYRKAIKLEQQDEKIQINLLLLHMGSKVNKLLATLQKKEDDLKSYKEAVKLFEDYYITKTNIIFQRAVFNQRNQLETEAAEEYIATVVELGRKCKYDALEEELVRDRLVVGIRDVKLSEILQLDGKLTLQTAIDKILQSESIKIQNREIHHSEKGIDTIRFRKKINNNKPNYMNMSKKNDKRDTCTRCGMKPRHPYLECKARNVQCYRCSLKGHYGKMCRTKNAGEVEETSTKGSNSSQSDIELGEVKMIDSFKTLNPPWRVKLHIGKANVRFKVDTGADESILAWHVYKQLPNKYNMKKTNDILVGPGQTKLNVKGKVNLPVEWNGIKINMQAYVLDTKENLLGRSDIVKLGILKVRNETYTHFQMEMNDKLDINAVKNLTLKEKMVSEYSDLFKGLGQIKNMSYNIKVREGAPSCVTTPRRIPFVLMEPTRKEIERMKSEGVIEEITDPTDYCAPMVLVVKGTGEEKKIRICTDYTGLNKQVIRERFQLPSVDEALTEMRGSKIFTKLDLKNGFWQLPISKQSRHYTCLITPFGRFVYKRLPQGLSSSPEVYQRTIGKILEKIPKVKVHIDDIIIFSNNEDEHEKNVRRTLDVLRENGITLNKEKCKFGLKKLKFLGHVLEEDGKITPDPERLTALIEYPEPKNVKELQRFLGMYNYLTKFILNSSSKSQGLRSLLNKDQTWIWDEQHKKCFEEMKQTLTNLPILASYDVNKESRISADASAYGIGGCLEQLQEDNTWKPIMYCSKSLSDTEKMYAQIEKESLAIVWVCERLKQYILGKRFEIRTDHLPLLRILQTKPIDKLSARLQRFRMRMMCFDYEMKHVSGKEFYVADALSRAPLNDGKLDEDVLNQNIELNEIYQPEYQNTDEVINLLSRYVEHGWPEKYQCPQIIYPYYKYKDDIGLVDGIVCYQDRIIVPRKDRREVLEKIHMGHQGMTKCRARIKECIWWPQINNHIEEIIKNCETCIKNSRITTEPLLPYSIPSRPWEVVAIDLFEHESQVYLLITDYYSSYPEIYKLKDKKSNSVIYKLKETFARHGIPEQIRSDNGKQFDCEEFRKFCLNYDIKFTTSSPHYAQSNGKVERCVGAMKNLLRKNKKDFYLALLIYRNTPLQSGESPAKRLMGRNLRDTIPVTKYY